MDIDIDICVCASQISYNLSIFFQLCQPPQQSPYCTCQLHVYQLLAIITLTKNVYRQYYSRKFLIDIIPLTLEIILIMQYSHSVYYKEKP